MTSPSNNLDNITNKSSAGPQDQHGQKKDRFNFNEYYEKKRNIQSKLNAKFQSHGVTQKVDF